MLVLDPGCNLIVGSSDSGKSSIIRALKWLATNRPLGDGFVSWGSEGVTAVEVLLDDGVSITHEPGSYSLIKGKERQDWSAIGTGVPETVSQELNISELSWAHQMDAPFLLSASPGEVARTLNEVADLDKIDTALANINRMARDNRSELTTTVVRKRDLEISLSEYKDLDDQVKRINQLAEMERRAQALEKLVDEGDSLLEAIEQEKERLSGIKDMADAEAELDLLMDMVGQIKNIDASIDKMENLLLQVDRIRENQKQTTETLKRLEKTWTERFEGKACPLCGRSG